MQVYRNSMANGFMAEQVVKLLRTKERPHANRGLHLMEVILWFLIWEKRTSIRGVQAEEGEVGVREEMTEEMIGEIRGEMIVGMTGEAAIGIEKARRGGTMTIGAGGEWRLVSS